MLSSRKNTPGVVVAGLRGGSGKTIICLGITAAWKHQNIRVSPFKKGPDYIDAGWLTTAAGRPCHNLDTYLCTQDVVQDSYARHSRDAEISVVEGNRGLYDGLDIEGSTSTAELAKLLNLPILLVLDCTKSTRTMAAILMRCIHFDPSIKIGGVILNRVAGKRHEQKIRDNIKHFCDVPVFGVVPKLRAKDFPERHMGLVTSEEHGFSHEAIEAARVIAEKYIDLEALKAHVLAWEGEASWSSCQGQPCSSPKTVPVSAHGESPLTIGVIRDSAFQFYYPDNIAALEALGAKIVYISPLKEDTIPRVHAIYMG
ncbi:MAG: cobyrinate a,c-diamide synthase, partial [Desulfovibrionales bacterium]|nr:cobyrinate a,c-diamide synthase [Desulfovibrionales bacterium]